MAGLEIAFDGRPSAAAYMLRALYPGFLRRRPPFPPLRARWRGVRAGGERLRRFLDATALDASAGLPLLYLQVLTFPLQMVILTHPACPLPIWKVLQVRNHLLRRRPIAADAALDAEAAVVGQRVLERGMELDVRVSVRVRGEEVWEGLTSYWYRGRFGAARSASPLAAAPEVPRAEAARWRTEPGGGLRFGGISGDYNGIHWSSAYARLFGFRGPFHHPHQLAGRCLARLPGGVGAQQAAQRLDLWLKGPVYYGSEVSLAAAPDAAGVAFALWERGSVRPALVGRWRAAADGSRLEDDAPSGAMPV
jgi:acyl dehydratase